MEEARLCLLRQEEEGTETLLPTPCHLAIPLCLLREKAPKEKPSQPPVRQPRQGPTNEAQMAAAAALARLEQKQPRARGPTSQDSIRNQGEPQLSSSHGGGTWGRWSRPISTVLWAILCFSQVLEPSGSHTLR